MEIESAPYYVPINAKTFGDRQTTINHRTSYQQQQQPQPTNYQPVMSARMTQNYSMVTNPLHQNSVNLNQSNYNDFTNPNLRRSQATNNYMSNVGNNNSINNLSHSNYLPHNQNNYLQNSNNGPTNFHPAYRQQ